MPVKDFESRSIRTPEQDSLAAYQVITHKTSVVGEEKIYEVSGDTIFVAEINASHPIFIRIGTRRNPWVRLRVGDLYKRDFRRITIKNGQASLLQDTSTLQNVTLYVSRGDFIFRQSITPGISRGFVARAGQAPTAYQPLDANMGLAVSTFGKSGNCWLVLRNLDAANYLGLQYGSVSAVLAAINSYVLPPGGVIELPILSQLNGAVEALQIASLTAPPVAFAAGVCQYTVLYSALERDGTDIDLASTFPAGTFPVTG